MENSGPFTKSTTGDGALQENRSAHIHVYRTSPILSAVIMLTYKVRAGRFYTGGPLKHENVNLFSIQWCIFL